jgi:hypothetical protein
MTPEPLRDDPMISAEIFDCSLHFFVSRVIIGKGIDMFFTIWRREVVCAMEWSNYHAAAFSSSELPPCLE